MSSHQGILNKKLLLWVAALLTIINLVLVWSHLYFPSQNGPGYILIVKMMRDFSHPAFNYSDFYQFFFLLIPNLVFHSIVYLLSLIIPLLTAYKIVISINLILLPASVFYLIYNVDQRKTLYGFAVYAYTFNYYVIKGYDSYYMGLAFSFFTLGYFFKYKNLLRTREIISLALLFVITYVTHFFSFFMILGIIILYLLTQKNSLPQIKKVLIATIPSLLLFTQYLIFTLQRSHSLVTGGKTYWIRFHPLFENIKDYLRMSNYSVSDGAIYVFWVLLVFLFYQLAKTGYQDWRVLQKEVPDDSFKEKIAEFIQRNPFMFVFFVLSVMYFILPFEVAGWPKLNNRLLPYIFVLLLMIPKPFSHRKQWDMFLTTSVVVSLIIYGFTAYYLITANQMLEIYLSGLPYVEQNKKLLPVHLEEYVVGKIRPLRWAFNYYNFYKGGATGLSFAYVTGRAPIQYTKPVDEILPRFYPEAADKMDMSKFQKAYDYVLFWGEDEHIFNMFRSSGFKEVFHNQKLRIFENIIKKGTAATIPQTP